MKLRPTRIRVPFMKKITLILVAVLGMMTATKAQTLIGEFPSFHRVTIIPGYFTTTGHPYICDYIRDEVKFSIYQSDFVTHVTDIDASNLQYADDAEYVDLDTYSEEQDIMFTQSLFNDDAFFEYFEKEENCVTYYDTVYWYDSYMDTMYCEVYSYDYCYTTGVKIMSTNGNTIWSYQNEGGCDVEALIKFDNKFYFILYAYDPSLDREVAYLYLIKQGQGVSKVEAPLPITAFPTMPSRDQQITVELGEGTNAHEITVVNSLGQEVKRIPLERGQRTVTIPAHDLSRGLNVLNARSDRNQGSCKIIVK